MKNNMKKKYDEKRKKIWKKKYEKKNMRKKI